VDSVRPIIFGAESIRGILAGAKTQTRRLVTLREFGPSDTPGYEWTFRDRRGLWNDVNSERLRAMCPYGDGLRVRETWALAKCHDNDVTSRFVAPWPLVWYRADNGGEPARLQPLERGRDMRGHWRSPIYMPRWASRLTLRVTGVRVERLQAITEADAIAEGCVGESCADCCVMFGVYDPECGRCLSARVGYEMRWDAINGKRAPWRSKPWVWVVEFERVEP